LTKTEQRGVNISNPGAFERGEAWKRKSGR
jgi:hypothetical protein